MQRCVAFDAVIVGTGFGGAVCGARLAARGLRTLLLERGPWWGPAGEGRDPEERRPFPRGFTGAVKFLRNVRVARGRRSRDLVVNAGGLFEVHLFDALTVVTGSGVGGGSLVYTSILQEPEDAFFAAFPPEITAAEMRPYYERVRSMLRPSPTPHPSPKSAAFDRAAAEAGHTARRPELAVAFGDSPDRPSTIINAAGLAQQTCSHCGECIVGCPKRAKTTLDLTYLPVALRHGAELRALCEVQAIEAGRGEYRVHYLDRRRRREHVVSAPRVVLSAGTLNTTRLLFRARDRDRTLPNVSRLLGERFSTNGDCALWLGGALAGACRAPSIETWVLSSAGDSPFAVAECGVPATALPALVRGRVARAAPSGVVRSVSASSSSSSVSPRPRARATASRRMSRIAARSRSGDCAWRAAASTAASTTESSISATGGKGRAGAAGGAGAGSGAEAGATSPSASSVVPASATRAAANAASCGWTARASAAICSFEGLVLPDSHRAAVRNDTPRTSPSSLWLKPSARRARPTRAVISGPGTWGMG